MSRQATQSAPQSAPNTDVNVGRSQFLDASLDKAHRLAMSQHHGGVSSEHLLFALTEDPEALVVLGASTVNIERLRADITTHLGQLPNDTPTGKAILPTADLLKVLKLAAMAAQQSARRQIDGAIVLAAVIGDASTPSAGLLRAHGLTFAEVIQVLQKSAGSAAPSQRPAQPSVQAPEQLAEPAAVPPSPVVAHASNVRTQAAATLPHPSDVSPAPATATGAAPLTVKPAPTARPSTDELLASVRARLQENAPPPPPSRRTDKPFAAEVIVSAQSAPTSAHAEKPTSSAQTDDLPSPASATDTAVQSVQETIDPPTVAIAPVHPAASEGARTNIAAPAWQDGTPASAIPSENLPRTPDDLPRTQPTHPLQTPQTAQGPVLLPPLPLVPASAQRGGPPPLPLPTLVTQPTAPVRVAPQGSMPAPLPPVATVAPSMTREPTRVPAIPQPSVDMRSLVVTFPKRLRQGQTDIIEIIVPRRSLEIPPSAGHRWPPLRVATMRLKAGGQDAHVELASPETLWINPPRVHQGADDATWRWRVTPRSKGRIKLTLAGATRIVGAEGISGEVPLGEESIEIDVARRGSRRGLVGLLLFGNLLAIGFLAMIMSGRAGELIGAAWDAIRRLAGLA